MKKKSISLAFKLNLLLTSMVLIVSLVLVNISVDSYSRTVYESVYQKLDAVERAMPESKEHILDRSYKVQSSRGWRRSAPGRSGRMTGTS